ncbi:hypothetical protein C8R47DRAFT_1193884 [Mycena vitilis]|nr:hypothetical protein C8R47DRAFT_1193884 [Mycena vitilis]
MLQNLTWIRLKGAPIGYKWRRGCIDDYLCALKTAWDLFLAIRVAGNTWVYYEAHPTPSSPTNAALNKEVLRKSSRLVRHGLPPHHSCIERITGHGGLLARSALGGGGGAEVDEANRVKDRIMLHRFSDGFPLHAVGVLRLDTKCSTPVKILSRPHTILRRSIRVLPTHDVVEAS